MTAMATKNSATGTDGVSLIAAERRRQLDTAGWTAEHDDAHVKNEMLDAAVLYAYAARWAGFANMSQPMPVWARDNHAYWPWDDEKWAPSEDPVTNLVKAGALIAAEIDRLQRAGASERDGS